MIFLQRKQADFFFFLFSNAYTLHAMNIAALAAFADEKPAKEKKKCR